MCWKEFRARRGFRIDDPLNATHFFLKLNIHHKRLIVCRCDRWWYGGSAPAYVARGAPRRGSPHSDSQPLCWRQPSPAVPQQQDLPHQLRKPSLFTKQLSWPRGNDPLQGLREVQLTQGQVKQAERQTQSGEAPTMLSQKLVLKVLFYVQNSVVKLWNAMVYEGREFFQLLQYQKKKDNFLMTSFS